MSVPSYFQPNTIYCGDCRDVLRKFPNECVDFIYADPPFFSNRHYEVIWRDGYELLAFSDRWKGGIQHYVSWMMERLEECYRVLKNTGSMYLHCDWHASHYLKVERWFKLGLLEKAIKEKLEKDAKEVIHRVMSSEKANIDNQDTMKVTIAYMESISDTLIKLDDSVNNFVKSIDKWVGRLKTYATAVSVAVVAGSMVFCIQYILRMLGLIRM